MPINYGQGFKEGGGQMLIDSVTDAQGRNVYGTAGGDPYTFDPWTSLLPDTPEYAGLMRAGGDPREMMNTGSFFPQGGLTWDKANNAKYDPTYGYLLPKSVMDGKARAYADSGTMPGQQFDFMSTYGPAIFALPWAANLIGAAGAGAGAAGATGSTLPESYWSMLASNGTGGTAISGGGALGAADIAGLTQMGQAAGLTGSALSHFVSSGGAAAASGGGLSSVLSSLGNYFSGDGLSSALSSVGKFLSSPNGMNIAGQLFSGLMGANSSGAAANAQQNAANAANANTMSMYQQNRADMAPWRNVGEGALNSLATRMGVPGSTGVANSGDPQFGMLTKNFGMSDFQADPGYGFRMSEGLKALQNSAAARGSLMSGGTMKGLERFGQNLASDEYTNAFNRYTTQNNNLYNRLAGLSGTGQVQSQQMAAQGANAANTMGQNILGAGNAQAAGIMGRSNAMTGAIGQGMNFYNNNRLLDMLQGRNSGGGSSGGSYYDGYNDGPGYDYGYNDGSFFGGGSSGYIDPYSYGNNYG